MATPTVTVRARPQVRKKAAWWQPTRKTALHILFALPMALCAYAGLTLVADTLWNFTWTVPEIPGGLNISLFEINPIETVIRFLGDWALRFIILTLAVSPAARLFRRPALVQYRRMVGLWAFAYAFIHMATFICVDQFFDWAEIGKQITHNRFIIVGMSALILMLPLAITSTRGWVRRMGFRRWQMLHRLVYISGICGAIHYIWMVKLDIRQPLVYAVLVAILLGLRLFWSFKDRMPKQPVPVVV